MINLYKSFIYIYCFWHWAWSFHFLRFTSYAVSTILTYCARIFIPLSWFWFLFCGGRRYLCTSKWVVILTFHCVWCHCKTRTWSCWCLILLNFRYENLLVCKLQVLFVFCCLCHFSPHYSIFWCCSFLIKNFDFISWFLLLCHLILIISLHYFLNIRQFQTLLIKFFIYFLLIVSIFFFLNQLLLKFFNTLLLFSIFLIDEIKLFLYSVFLRKMLLI